MKIKFPLVSFGFIALAALMVYLKTGGHGWVIFCAILSASQFIAKIGEDINDGINKKP
jgi:hypothetical protein